MINDIENVLKALNEKMNYCTLHHSYGNYAATAAYQDAIILLEVVLDKHKK